MAQVPRPDPFPNAEKAWVEPEEGGYWWCESTQLLITSNDTFSPKGSDKNSFGDGSICFKPPVKRTKERTANGVWPKRSNGSIKNNQESQFLSLFSFCHGMLWADIINISKIALSGLYDCTFTFLISSFFQFIFSVSFLDFGPSYFMNFLRYLKIINQVEWMPICAHFS